MLQNYLKVALRHLRRQKGYAFINVLGLALGLACCILILRYVRHEVSYDRFHVHAERIHRVTLDGQIGDYELEATTTAAPLAFTLAEAFPEVENAVRIDDMADLPVRVGDRLFSEREALYADSTFFEVFTFPLVAGDPATALDEPYSVVLTRETARRYFGEAEALGRTVSIYGDTYAVTGVAENVPATSHFHFDLLLSFATSERSRNDLWVQNSLRTYLLLTPNADPEAVRAKFPAFIRKHVGPQIAEASGIPFDQFLAGGARYGYGLQPLTDIHLHSHLDGEFEPNGNAKALSAFAAIAVFVLLLACVNFMNLATARSAERAKEIGVRKAIGSGRGQLAGQFLAESVLMSAFALGLAAGLVELVRPWFNSVAQTEIAAGYLEDPLLLPALVGLTLFVGVVAGSYPALYLSGLQPAGMLKGTSRSSGGSARLRNGLVVFQFAISIALIVGTGVVYNQLRFMQTQDLGFDREHVVVIPQAQAIDGHREAFLDALRAAPDVVAAEVAHGLPGDGVFDQAIYQNEDRPGSEHQRLLATMYVGYDLPETLGLEFIAGRPFSPAFATDSTAYILNETAVRALGWQAEDAVGRFVYQPSSEGNLAGEVVGVVRDFHFESLHTAIQPAVLRLVPSPRVVAVRVRGDRLPATIDTIRRTWEEYAGGQPFAYSFLDDDFDQLYQADQRAGQLVLTFSGLAILIACLGLFGLASFAAERRRKEIGVRKVLGASVPGLVTMFSKDFLRLVLVAFVVAAPLVYFAMRQWLQDFAYRIDLGPGVFLLAGLLAGAVALATVGWQAFRAATADPVEALRSE